jgi:hypothetical protein
MSAGRSKLPRKQEAAIVALLTERTHAAAAKAGIGEAALQRWLRDPGFVAAYRAARRQIVEGGISRLQQVFGDAVDTLRRNLTCGTPSAEIRAAATILEQAVKGVELADLVEEVEELKQAFADRGKKS